MKTRNKHIHQNPPQSCCGTTSKTVVKTEIKESACCGSTPSSHVKPVKHTSTGCCG